MKEEDGRFKVTRVTKISDLAKGNVTEIPESDLTIQDDGNIVQFEYIEGEEKERDKIKIKPGCFSIVSSNVGPVLDKVELRSYNLLETIDNTSTIINEKDKFFSRLDVYKTLNRDPKRSILLCSPPGVGKTASINEVCKKALDDSGAVVIIWDTSSINASDVNKFFLNNSVYEDTVTKVILVIEDIEGGTTEDNYGARGSESALLNFLDGIGNPFKNVPTFIIATTNNPERSVGALIDRPGRFDKVIELKTPNKEECSNLLKFIMDDSDIFDDDCLLAAERAAKEEFSIAHLQEVVVRSKIDDILIAHKKRFKEAFAKAPKGKIGIS
jgi:SpoVK/Ycf46/Vps4 family AAA+-type ATPase